MLSFICYLCYLYKCVTPLRLNTDSRIVKSGSLCAHMPALIPIRQIFIHTDIFFHGINIFSVFFEFLHLFLKIIESNISFNNLEFY